MVAVIKSLNTICVICSIAGDQIIEAFISNDHYVTTANRKCSNSMKGLSQSTCDSKLEPEYVPSFNLESLLSRVKPSTSLVTEENDHEKTDPSFKAFWINVTSGYKHSSCDDE